MTGWAAVSEDRISLDLRELTELLSTLGEDISGGLLGGEYGYGCEYWNDVFEMHAYWWGECDCGLTDGWDGGRQGEWLKANPHDSACYQSVIRTRGYDDAEDADEKRITDAVCAEMELDPEWGSAAHCTCYRAAAEEAFFGTPEGQHNPKCGVQRPNFRHHRSGVEVRWYKYIGRGMEYEEIARGTWQRIMSEVRGSLGVTE